MPREDKKTIAVDFDGTLCEYDFPSIGKQSADQKQLIKNKLQTQEVEELLNNPLMRSSLEEE